KPAGRVAQPGGLAIGPRRRLSERVLARLCPIRGRLCPVRGHPCPVRGVPCPVRSHPCPVRAVRARIRAQLVRWWLNNVPKPPNPPKVGHIVNPHLIMGTSCTRSGRFVTLFRWPGRRVAVASSRLRCSRWRGVGGGESVAGGVRGGGRWRCGAAAV